MIDFQQVSKIYPGGQMALEEVNFHLQNGEMAFLTGHSGAGKSTLLKLITVIERATTGRVAINGHDIAKISPKHVPYLRRNIGMIFQNHHLLMDRSVFDNVALPLVIEGFSHGEIRKRVAGALDMVGLYGKERHNPIMLSGGEQQRVGIARAIVNKPPLLLADEPTGNLDHQTAESIYKLLRELNRELKTSFIVVTHDLALAARLDRHVSMRDGRLELAHG